MSLPFYRAERNLTETFWIRTQIQNFIVSYTTQRHRRWMIDTFSNEITIVISGNFQKETADRKRCHATSWRLLSACVLWDLAYVRLQCLYFSSIRWKLMDIIRDAQQKQWQQHRETCGLSFHLSETWKCRCRAVSVATTQHFTKHNVKAQSVSVFTALLLFSCLLCTAAVA